MTEKEQNKKTSATSGSDDNATSSSTDKDAAAQNNTISAAQATKIAAKARASKKPTQANQEKPNKGAPSTPPSAKSPTKKPATKPARQSTNEPGNKISKVGVLALLIALTAAAGTVGHYTFQQQQNQSISSTANQASLEKLAQLEQQLARQIQQNKQLFTQQLNDLGKELGQKKDQEIAELQQALTEVISQKPDNSEVTEAEYLVRMAGRVLWLEKNVDTAIGLLNDADNRLSQVNDPRMLSIRQLLHQDIEQLKLLPRLQTDEIILTFMGLAKQVGNLPLASLQLPEATDQPVDTELSDDVNDWRENLAKTWQSFKEEFITVRRRTGQVEALMEPQFQRNLYHNLELKIQQIQWAASQKSTKLYAQSITDLELWLNSHFDMSGASAKQFSKRLSDLKVMPVNVEYPNALASLTALQNMLSDKSKQAPAPLSKPEQTEQTLSPTEQENAVQEESL